MVFLLEVDLTIQIYFRGDAGNISVFKNIETIIVCNNFYTTVNLTTELKRIEAPTLVLAAHKDRLTTLKANEFIKSQITGAHIDYVKFGHLSLMEN